MILNLYISYHYTRQQLNARSIRKIIIKAQRFRASALIFTLYRFHTNYCKYSINLADAN